MSKIVLTDVRSFFAGCDITGVSNKCELVAEVDEQETTNFASGGWKEFIGGLRGSSIDVEGYWEAGDATRVDDAIEANRGAVVPWSIVPTSGAVGSLAYLSQALSGGYTLLGAVGDVAPYALKASGSWPLVRGQVAHPTGTPRTATGTGSNVTFTAGPTSTQYMYAALHVLSMSGTSTPTITVRVESDDNAGFTSATTRATFNAATAVGGQITRVAGSITDTYWRAAWTISGTTPSFLFAVTLGIS